MTDILFGQSYYLYFDPKLYAAMQPYPPLGTLYAVSYMRARGWSAALFDAMLSAGPHEWDSALRQHTPRYAVIFEDNFNYLSKMSLLRMREAAFLMLDYAKACGTVTIACGADMTDHAELYLQRGADFVLIGEGEETLAELVAFLDAAGARSADNLPDDSGPVCHSRPCLPSKRPGHPNARPSRHPRFGQPALPCLGMWLTMRSTAACGRHTTATPA
jgi:hypothetical protein